jgi:AAHS family 4-hydroxybenzoate transporter-like MFS transporter
MPLTDARTLLDRPGISGFQVTVALLSASVLFLDGFDTQAVSYAAPSIGQELHVPRALLGPVLSSGLAGLMAGYLLLSPLADRVGYKRIVVGSTAAFALLTLATVAAASLTQLIALRFLTGLGLGAAVPAAVALTGEYSPRRLRASFVLAIYCGFSLGFVAAGFAASELLGAYGWTSLFWAGAILPLLLCPVLAALLPESLDHLVRSGASTGRIAAVLRRIDPALPVGDLMSRGQAAAPATMAPAKTGAVLGLLRDGRAAVTLLLWAVFTINLSAFYLLQSWLPTLLTGLHRPIGEVAAATSLSTVGGIAAAFVVGPAMDRLGACRSLAALYAAGAIGVALLGPALPAAMWKLSLASFFAGFCVSGGQKSAIALATLFYPSTMRAAGLGWALGIGRAGGIAGPVVAGLLLGAGWTPTWLFYGVAATLAAAALATIAMQGRPGFEGIRL